MISDAMTTCRVCGADAEVCELNTYKSRWYECSRCGCYWREHKRFYALEFVAPLLRMCGRHGTARILGHKEQGVDAYRYYSAVLATGNRGNWAGEFTRVSQQLAEYGFGCHGKAILDISGEPGYFAADAMADGARSIVVTSFADSVALAIREHLGLEAAEFDYQRHRLAELFADRRFDIVFVRYSVGFCTDVTQLFRDLRSIIVPGGLLYISFSPASRGVCARWMFDDYTYLVQYTNKHLEAAAGQFELELLNTWSEGSYHYQTHHNVVHRLLAKAFIGRQFFKNDTKEMMQSNAVMLFRAARTGS